MTQNCSKCGKPAENNYGPLGYLCYWCERKPLTIGETAGCVGYYLFAFVVLIGIAFFLAHVG